MTDPLDRAAQAAYEAAFRAAPDAPWKTWDTIPEDWRNGYRRDASAALRVMADDIRARYLTIVRDEFGRGISAARLERILDSYTGGQS